MSAMVHIVLMAIGCNDGRHECRCDVPCNKEMGMMMGADVALVGDRVAEPDNVAL